MTQENARKDPMGQEAAWALLSAAEEIITARGKTIRRWDPKTDPKDEILADVIGRSGNLRAPTVKVGNVFIVGYSDDIYREILGG